MHTVSAAELRSLAERVFQAVGAPPAEARIVADHLVESNLRGVDSHGVIRIPQYVDETRAGGIRPGASITISHSTPSTAIVDCGWNFGPVGAAQAMTVAIEKARAQRAAAVTTRGCNHAGRMGAYVEMAAKEGFLALAFCSSPKHGHFVVPWGGREGRLSTNPIAFGIPAGALPPIVADFSTSATPEGKIRLHRNRAKQLPEGWILDGRGRPSTDPSDFYGPPPGVILPFGGKLGYRGYALGLLVEVLATIFAGYDSTADRPGNGVAFIVLDPNAFLPAAEYAALMQKMAAYVQSSAPANRQCPVMLPGGPELQAREERMRNGVPIEESTWELIQATAASLLGGGSGRPARP